MDETDLVVPWEKQQRLLYPLDPQSSSPVRKSFSYAGVLRGPTPGQPGGNLNNEASAAVAAISTPLTLTPNLPTTDERRFLDVSPTPSTRKSSMVSDPMSIIFQAGAKMKFVPFFARQGISQVALSGSSLSSAGESSFGLIRFVIASCS